MERQRHEDELKNRATKKSSDADQNRATSPQSEAKEVSNLQILGPAGEITAGFMFKRSAKGNDWSRRWFVLNEKSGKLGYTKKQEERHFRGVINLEECNLEEVLDEEDPPRSAKDSKRSSGTDFGKAPSLIFKITNKVAYKHILKAHSAVVLKAETMTDKTEWVTKIKSIVAKRTNVSEGGSLMRQSHSDGSLVSVSKKEGSLDAMLRKPADPEEELRWISQEVRGYVEAVLSSLAANVPKAVVLCQIEKAKEDMLNQLYTSISTQSIAKIEELIQEDHNVKRRRKKFQMQSSLLSKVTRLLSIHDNRSNDSAGSDISLSTDVQPGEEWRSAFDASSHVGQNSNTSQDGDSLAGTNSGIRRMPSRMPPPLPPGRSLGVELLIKQVQLGRSPTEFSLREHISWLHLL